MPDLISTPEQTRAVAERWFAALHASDTAAVADCLAQDVVWVNNPPVPGLSDIVPWLGEYHGRAAVLGSFAVWGERAAVQQFELRKLLIDGAEALAVVHEVALIKATGLYYDIEFIQRLRVAGGTISHWQSYWDTVKGIVPFRGNLAARLLAAATAGDVAAAELVLPFGADPNTTDPASGQTALMLAAARGHLALVQTLLQAGANPNVADRRAGATALHKACQGGSLPVVRALVEAGAFINQQATTTGHTALVEAIWYKAADVVEYLLGCQALLTPDTYYGFKLDDHLNYALLVNKGAGSQQALLRIKDLVAQRRAADAHLMATLPLCQAVLAGNLAAVQAALAVGAHPEERWPMFGSFQDGHTPLLIAARDAHQNEPLYAAIVQALLAAGADVNAVEPVFGAVPLHKATYHGCATITRLLATAPDVNLNYQGPANGYTPLHDALWHGYPACAEVLLDAGARVDLISYDGKLAVDIAVAELGADSPIVALLRSLLPH